MTIGIDASRALKQRTGTEWYNAEIIKHLAALDHEHAYRLYASREPYGDMLNLGDHVTWRVMPFPRGWTLIRLSLEMIAYAPDVLFIPAHTLPLYPGKRSVVMIHDLGYDHYPELYKWTDIVYHRFDVRFAKYFATHILTPSEFTRQDLHARYGIPLKKITAIHHGFDPSSYRPAKAGEKSPVEEPYFFYIGRLERKKNITRMLEAFGQFKRETGLPHKFILAGRPAHGYEAIEAAHEALGPIKKDVIFLGYTDQEKATNYLRHCQAMVFASLFEGFGMPVLEAFASGVPVITSTVTSLPEVAGEAALLVNPRNVSEISDAMGKIAQDETLRRELIAKGSEQYKKFSWDKTARETLAVLTKVGRS